MESGALPVVRIADDGDLDDVRHLLEQLGVEWMAEDEEPDRATALWIGNPHRLIGELPPGAGAAGAVAFRIVVADKMTNMLRRALDRARPDFLVSRPFHPAALRLLILHALYLGPERRASARVAVSAAVHFRVGRFSRSAMLVELSRGGCRLIAGRVPALGDCLTLMLPRELTGNGGLSLAGRVVATDPAGGFEPGEQACSIAFESLDIEKRRALRDWMSQHALGRPFLAQKAKSKSAARPRAGQRLVASAKTAARPPVKTAAQAPPSSDASDRRRSPRRPYHRPTLAAGGGIARILMGRDISSGGMRVAPNADLIVGDVLKLVIYGPAGRPPLVLRAVVFRDDGSDGCVLRFENLAPATVAELDEWTTRLPDLGASTKRKAPAVHSIVSEVVEEPEGSE